MQKTSAKYPFIIGFTVAICFWYNSLESNYRQSMHFILCGAQSSKSFPKTIKNFLKFFQ